MGVRWISGEGEKRGGSRYLRSRVRDGGGGLRDEIMRRYLRSSLLTLEGCMCVQESGGVGYWHKEI